MKVSVDRVEPTDPARHWVPGDGFFFEHAGRTVCALGSALTLTIPGGPDQVARAAARASEALAALDAPSDGPAPPVVGALPFDGSAQAVLVVPAVTYLKERDRTWRITVGDPVPAEARAPARPGFEPLRIHEVPARESYVAAVEKARARIRAGELDKVVLARMLIAQATHPIDRRALLARLREAEPDAFVFAAQGFIGASPELLVARRGRAVRSTPLAGTIARAAEQARARLFGSAKDRHEHAIVVDAVRDALEPVCDKLSWPSEPGFVGTSTVWHLATPFDGRLRDPVPHALTLAARLHPTPAVCGTPREPAMRAIGELEEIDRALYAGLVGWMDARGDGEWAVVLRCAEVAGRIALLFAGAGIVGDSDPHTELAETDAKFTSMLEALGRA